MWSDKKGPTGPEKGPTGPEKGPTGPAYKKGPTGPEKGPTGPEKGPTGPAFEKGSVRLENSRAGLSYPRNMFSTIFSTTFQLRGGDQTFFFRIMYIELGPEMKFLVPND